MPNMRMERKFKTLQDIMRESLNKHITMMAYQPDRNILYAIVEIVDDDSKAIRNISGYMKRKEMEYYIDGMLTALSLK